MRRYRVLLPLQVQPREGGSYEQHDEFEAELTADEETENVKSGLIAIVPVKYRVTGDNDVFENKPGDEFEAALPMGNEALLLEGGWIERVVPPETEPAEKPARAKKEAK